MEQKFDGTPKANVRLTGRKVIRDDVMNDWGLQLRWLVKKDGKVVATPPARADASYEHADVTPGTYEIVLQSWKYVDYAKGADGEFTRSQFVNISAPVKYKI